MLIDSPSSYSRRSAAILRVSRELHTFAQVGHWLATKAMTQAATVGVQQAARNLRKQGVPIELALMVLVGRVQ